MNKLAEDIVSNILMKLGSRAKMRDYMSKLYNKMQGKFPGDWLTNPETGIAPRDEAANKMYDIIQKMHALGDKKIVPITKRDAMGGFNTAVGVELNPAINDEFMARGLTDKPWLVTAKKQLSYENRYPNSKAIADVNATKETGDYQGRKLLEKLQKDTNKSKSFAPTITDDASGITYNPFILNKGSIGAQPLDTSIKYVRAPLRQVMELTLSPEEKGLASFGNAIGMHGRIRTRNVSDFMANHTEGLSALRGRVDAYNKKAKLNNTAPIVSSEEAYQPRLLQRGSIVEDMHDDNILVKDDKGTTRRDIMDKVMPNDAGTDTSIIDFSTPRKGEDLSTANYLPAAKDQYQGEKARTYNDSLKGKMNPYREEQHYFKKPEVVTPGENVSYVRPKETDTPQDGWMFKVRNKAFELGDAIKDTFKLNRIF